MTQPVVPVRQRFRGFRAGLAGVVLLVVAVSAIAGAVIVSAHHRPGATSESDGVASIASGKPSSANPVPRSSFGGSSAYPTVPTTAESSDGEGPISSHGQTPLQQQVIAGYRAFEQTLDRQLGMNGTDMSPLTRVASSEVLATSEDAVAELRGEGHAQRGTPIFTDVAAAIISSSVVVVCATEDDGPTQIVVAKTGEVVASGFPKYETRTTMVLDDGVWKASSAVSVGAC